MNCDMKRSISLYSYQDEYYDGKLDLEGCLRETAKTGATGVELLAEQMIKKFPLPIETEEFREQWFGWLEKYHLTPSCYDAFLENRIFDNRTLCLGEQINMMKRDIRLASLLGFHNLRTLVSTPMEVIEGSLAYAQQMATEYSNLIVQQQAEIEQLEAERIAAEEEARRQAEAEAAAAAEEAARQEAEEEAAQEQENQEDQYDENTDEEDQEEISEDGEYTEDDGYTEDEDSDSEDSSDDENTDSSDDESTSDSSDGVEYDEYGNVIDSDNTVNPEDVDTSSSSSSSSSGSGSSIVDYALQFVGNPYVWGGTSLTSGADCSGFTQSVYAQFGYSLPRTSYEQQNWGTEVSYADAQPGDLICYGGHVAIYMGNGQIVHASNSQDGIKISNDATYRTILSVRRPS